MSWRQGFFRAWVLLSMIWVALTALFLYDSIVNPWVRDWAYAPSLGPDALAPKRKKVTDPAILEMLNGSQEQSDDEFDPFKDGAILLDDEPTLSAVDDAKLELRRAAKAELEWRQAEFVPIGDDGYDPIEEFSAQYRNFEQRVEAGKLQKVEIEGVPGIYLFMRTGTPPKRVYRHIEEVRPMAAALRNHLVSEKRTEALWSTLNAAFIPPLVVLVLGLAIAWVLAGFRRPPSTVR